MTDDGADTDTFEYGTDSAGGLGISSRFIVTGALPDTALVEYIGG